MESRSVPKPDQKRILWTIVVNGGVFGGGVASNGEVRLHTIQLASRDDERVLFSLGILMVTLGSRGPHVVGVMLPCQGASDHETRLL